MRFYIYDVVILEVWVECYLLSLRKNYEGLYFFMRIVYDLMIYLESEDPMTIV